MATALAQTPLYDWHFARGARLVDFSGWSMPVQYTSIVEEHQATRNAVGLFDISHMGRLRFEGSDALAFLDSILTRRVDTLKPGRIRYSLVTHDEGGILDDVLVYHIDDSVGNVDGSHFELVVNAGNREKIVSWLNRHRGSRDVSLIDRTVETAMIAVQGPRAIDILGPISDADLAGMKYYTSMFASIGTELALVSRTGYTGEDGFEVVVDAEAGETLWTVILDAAEEVGGRPAGLGARDTLRLEAAMPLYGHELDDKITPYQAGLDFAIDLEGRNFPGRDVLVRIKEDPALPRRVGIECEGRRLPRQGCLIQHEGENTGQITSGTFSPTLQRPIAMGYVAPRIAEPGTKIEIDVRGRAVPARVVELPFYKR